MCECGSSLTLVRSCKLFCVLPFYANTFVRPYLWFVVDVVVWGCVWSCFWRQFVVSHILDSGTICTLLWVVSECVCDCKTNLAAPWRTKRRQFGRVGTLHQSILPVIPSEGPDPPSCTSDFIVWDNRDCYKYRVLLLRACVRPLAFNCAVETRNTCNSCHCA